MGLGDIFHQFFFGPRCSPGCEHPEGKHPEQFIYEEGVDNLGAIGTDEDDINIMFGNIHGDVQRHFELMQKQMESIFQGFGTVIVPFESFPDGEENRSNPRDSMLKEPEHGMEDHPSVPDLTPSPSIQPFQHPRLFDGFFPKFDVGRPQIKEDKDMDNEVSDSDIANVFRKPDTDMMKPSRPQRGTFRGSSVSVTTVRGADGRIEEKRTVRDSSGREETTVTRTLGDQSHSITTKLDSIGTPEKIETFTNIKEENLKDFDEKWKKKPMESPQYPMVLPPASPRNEMDSLEPSDRSFYSRLFGIDLFGPKAPK